MGCDIHILTEVRDGDTWRCINTFKDEEVDEGLTHVYP
jgi:hypothetical protein